jgi:hypothetical protein
MNTTPSSDQLFIKESLILKYFCSPLQFVFGLPKMSITGVKKLAGHFTSQCQ